MVMSKDNKQLIAQLNDLIAVDFDAIEAYEAAIERLEDADGRAQLRSFLGDHQRHTTELSAHVRSLGGRPVTKPDFKRFLTKGKVVLANLAGDTAVLKAMRSNEEQTNSAYEEALREADSFSCPREVRDTLQKNLADERRHKSWIESRIDVLEHQPVR